MSEFFKKAGGKIGAFFRLVRIKVKGLIHFLTVDIWTLNINDLSKWKARLVKDIKTVQVMMNTFREQKMGFQISALCFQSTMAIVPLIAIAFFFASGVGISDMLEQFLYTYSDDKELIDTVMNAANNIIHTAQSGLFGFVSMLTFVWIVIWLMMRVEMVFNNAWKVQKPRKWWRQLGVIFVILMLSPFVILLFFTGSIVYSNVLDLIPNFEFADHLKSFLSWVIFAAVAVLIISLMYKYIPACKVKYRYALKAAVYAGIIFTALQYLYLETTVMVAKSSAVYGVLAAVPLFMVWLSWGWTIIIYGAELAYGFQTVESEGKTVEDLDVEIRESKRQRKNRRQEIFKK
ncbi:MAG: YihY/virulence factor BrkB family protein [Bacteroidales bacterium]|nr:YihY/virulence factor BrkB family protein [Bacteroidales bacterium]